MISDHSEPEAGAKAAISAFSDPPAFAERLAEAGPLLGLDVGTKTIGIALSDRRRRVASPLETLRRTRFADDARRLCALIDAHAVAGLVVGLPLNMDGSEGPRAQSVRAFVRNLGDNLKDSLRDNLREKGDLPVLLWDERLSTVAAERALLEADASRARRRQVIDKVAASLILQGALDRLANL